MDLQKISEEIRQILDKRRDDIGLKFFEDNHIYHMIDKNGKLRTDFPSVSSVYKKFYKPFDSEKKSLQMCDGDVFEAKLLREKWSRDGDYSTNLGSRVHYLLEKNLVEQYGSFKQVREPIFNCDNIQIQKSDLMIEGGKNFINLMHERGGVLLDTEIVLGDPDLGYVGQGDKAWLFMNKTKDDFGIIITDWKTNKEKNFKVQPYTDMMLPPFNNYHNTALSHYYIQLPLYGKLLLKMLEGTKYGNVKLLGSIVVHLKDSSEFVEYRVPQEISNEILSMDIKKYLK